MQSAINPERFRNHAEPQPPATINRHRPVVDASKLVFYLSSFLVILSVPAHCTSVPCCSVCDCKSREVWCERRALTSIPADIPENTRRIYLFENDISTIPEGSLSHLKDLELLDLSSNKLTNDAIKPGMLAELTSLSDLNLSENGLTKIKRNVFSGIGSLVRLYIEDNKIKSIESNALNNMSNLVELKLSRNHLSHFPGIVACPKLRRLCLGHNRLVRLQINSFAKVNLEQLTLSSNQLNQLPSTTFHDTSNMRELDISNNHISRLPRIISNMSSLLMLNLSGNSISSLPPDFLGNLRRMKILDLQGLRLTNLPKGFIPHRVYLNIFDISNNPWNCDCALSWLPEYMRAVEGAIPRLSEVRCSTPQALLKHQIVALYEENFACDSNLATSHRPPQLPLVPPRRKPTVDLCDGLSCANGATCFIKQTTRRPACRCLPGWKGLLCNRPLFTPTKSTFMTTTSTRSPSNDVERQLLIRHDTITSHSVEILFPTTGKAITVTTSEILPDGTTGPKTIALVYPDKYLYTVRNLLPGKKYNICISSTEVVHTSPRGTRTVEDKLCGEVATKLSSADDTEEFEDIMNAENRNDIEIVDDSAVDIEPDLRDDTDEENNAKTYQNTFRENSDKSAVKTTGDSDLELLYPVVGACIAVLIILTVALLLFICRRNKNKSKHVNTNQMDQDSEHETSTAGAFMLVKDGENVPMMAHPNCHTSQRSAQLMNSDVYQNFQQNHNGYTQLPRRTGTPIMLESLGRSSTSGGSFKGTQPYLDMQRCPSANSNPQYLSHVRSDMRGSVVPSGGVLHSNENAPILNNRGHDVVQYRHHGSPVPVEMVGKPISSTATFPASTAVNQYNQGPIFTTSTVSPHTTYHSMNNTASMQATGYPGCPPIINAQRRVAQCTPDTQLRPPVIQSDDTNCDAYYPLVTTPHNGDNSVRQAYQDTLVM